MTSTIYQMSVLELHNKLLIIAFIKSWFLFTSDQSPYFSIFWKEKNGSSLKCLLSTSNKQFYCEQWLEKFQWNMDLRHCAPDGNIIKWNSISFSLPHRAAPSEVIDADEIKLNV